MAILQILKHASRLLLPCTLKTHIYNNKMLTYGLHNNSLYLKPLANHGSMIEQNNRTMPFKLVHISFSKFWVPWFTGLA